MKEQSTVLMERPIAPGPISKVVGLYQTLMRRSLEHFFPDATLALEGDRILLNWDGGTRQDHYRLADDPDGLGVVIEWFGTRYVFQPGSPTPFLPAQRRLIALVL
ncbi:MAG: hypothetical protein JO329_03170, partial [Planctomycetaceae bacterium]|nr:hypothetical protein [Planctomycetaceae bacterium]